jgi:UDP-N-acetylglucosamine--N-acetylmuramyl-(pentapeptide) pyrophosphoryl-undecaprenol N-acetylglucosamine transferase
VLLVYGGSQGAQAINVAVSGWIANGLPRELHLIWSTGKKNFDAFAGFESERIRVRPYLSPIADAYAATDLAVARAGTMTLAELFAWKIPAVLVPLPTAAADHQTVNARTLERAGAAICLPQSQLTAESLARTVEQALGDRATLAALTNAAAARARPDAAMNIARRIVAIADDQSAHR